MKRHLCKICGETEADKFYKSERTLCKKHRSILNAMKIEECRLKIIAQLGNKCIACGESRIPSLEAHHVDPETKHRGTTVIYCLSKEALAEEIAKLICLCGTCHNILHYHTSSAHATQGELIALQRDSKALIIKGLKSIGLDFSTLRIGPVHTT